MCTCLSQVSCSNSSTVTSSSGSDTLLSPMGSISSRLKSLNNNNSCSESTTSSVSSLTSNYPKAPGFEREDQVHRLLSLTSGKLNPHTQLRALHFYRSHLSLVYCLPCHFNLTTSSPFPRISLFACHVIDFFKISHYVHALYVCDDDLLNVKHLSNITGHFSIALK